MSLFLAPIISRLAISVFAAVWRATRSFISPPPRIPQNRHFVAGCLTTDLHDSRTERMVKHLAEGHPSGKPECREQDVLMSGVPAATIESTRTGHAPGSMIVDLTRWHGAASNVSSPAGAASYSITTARPGPPCGVGLRPSTGSAWGRGFRTPVRQSSVNRIKDRREWQHGRLDPRRTSGS